MDADQLEGLLAEMFDSQLLFHGFTRFMRDYEVVVFVSTDPSSGREPRHLRFLFRHCTEASIRSRVRPDVWARSLGDELLDETHVSRDSQGYVWGVQGQEIYPGAQLVRDSERARSWSDATGIPFFEIQIEANAHSLNLVFSDLVRERVTDGFAPYVLGGAPEAEAYARGSKQSLSPPEAEN